MSPQTAAAAPDSPGAGGPVGTGGGGFSAHGV